jgi:hypothetical protein
LPVPNGTGQAAIVGRDYVQPDDVKALAEATLAHRIIVGPAARIKDISAQTIVRDILTSVPVPGASHRSTSLGTLADEQSQKCHLHTADRLPSGRIGQWACANVHDCLRAGRAAAGLPAVGLDRRVMGSLAPGNPIPTR